MKLYLVRHGKAEDTADDSGERPLSDRGMADIEAQAKFLGDAGIKVEQVFHSGKLRARQTAEILAARIAPGIPLMAMNNLAPMDAPDALIAALGDWSVDTMVCGHNPFMERIVALLLSGNEDAAAVLVKAGTVMCFENMGPGNWIMNWMVVPKLTRD